MNQSFAEPRRNRRMWLWIILGVLAACLICCAVSTVWWARGGEEKFYDWATRVAEEVTETARTPTPPPVN